jgi:histidine triad (HIT) family protein
MGYSIEYQGGAEEALNAEIGVAAERCLLCDIAAGKVQADRLYEDDLVVAFDIPPDYPWRQAPVHFLVISHEHIPSAGELRPEHGPLLARMFTVISQVARELGISDSGYRIVTNVGDDGGQTEYHLHLHCLGGRKLGAKG